MRAISRAISSGTHEIHAAGRDRAVGHAVVLSRGILGDVIPPSALIAWSPAVPSVARWITPSESHVPLVFRQRGDRLDGSVFAHSPGVGEVATPPGR